MPHIIVEYSRSIEESTDIPGLLQTLHSRLGEDIDIEKIKTRAHAFDNCLVGTAGLDGQMVHVTVLLLEGRPIETESEYKDYLFDLTKKAVPESCKVTIEVRDMRKETFRM